jgi:ubiquinone/menaquinone biosynthesis C-methylase UbiE
MTNKIKLLDSSLLEDRDKLQELDYWFRVMNRPNGWHYDLDHIWVLRELELAGILPGSTIVDAGAGQGIMQYLLSSRGYNVISLDFSSRVRPSRSAGIFDIRGNGEALINYKHPYMSFISYGGSSGFDLLARWRLSKLKKIPKLLSGLYRTTIFMSYYLWERFVAQHKAYGSITYLRAPFHATTLRSASADAVISISAIEHADIGLINDNIKELLRILKEKSPLLLTTSASIKDENEFHEKSSGWCFSLASLTSFFPNSEVEFDPVSCTRSLMQSQMFIKRLDPYYHQDKDAFCYKKKINKFPYLPVAVKIIK